MDPLHEIFVEQVGDGEWSPHVCQKVRAPGPRDYVKRVNGWQVSLAQQPEIYNSQFNARPSGIYVFESGSLVYHDKDKAEVVEVTFSFSGFTFVIILLYQVVAPSDWPQIDFCCAALSDPAARWSQANSRLIYEVSLNFNTRYKEKLMLKLSFLLTFLFSEKRSYPGRIRGVQKGHNRPTAQLKQYLLHSRDRCVINFKD